MHGLITIVITQQRHAHLEGELSRIVIAKRESTVSDQVIKFLRIVNTRRLTIVNLTTATTATALYADIFQLRVHLRYSLHLRQLAIVHRRHRIFVLRLVHLIERKFLRKDWIEEITLHIVLRNGCLVKHTLVLNATAFSVTDIRIIGLNKEDSLTIIRWHIKRETTTMVGFHLDRCHILTINQLSLKGHLLFQSATSLEQIIFTVNATDSQRRTLLI